VKNPRILFGILLVVLSMTLMVVMAATKRKPNVYDHAKWDPVFEFIRTADKLETLATTSNEVDYRELPVDLSKVIKQEVLPSTNKLQLVKPEAREKLIGYLKELPEETNHLMLCFVPHHFVIATKGSKRVVFSICFTCAQIEVNGEFSVHSGLRKKMKGDAAQHFGIDIMPLLEGKK
jgi:hypothetical protein